MLRAVAVVLIALFVALPAMAADLFEQAERDDAAFRFREALDGYDAALRADASSAKAAVAEQRAQILRTHSEGDFGPFVALERVRRDPTLGSSNEAIDALVREAETFPPGLVRVETWQLAAEAYANRLNRGADAIPLWKKILADPATDGVLREATRKKLGDELVARSRFKEAPRTPDVAKAKRRHVIHLVSIGAIGLALVLFVVAIVRSTNRQTLVPALRRSKLAVLYALYVGLTGAALATGYEEHTARPFLFFGLALLPLLLLAKAWSAIGSRASTAKLGRALVCGTSVLGAAFLVLEHVDIAYLEGLGL